MTELSNKAYTSFSELVRERLGINLGGNKQYLVQSRLYTLMRENNYDSLNSLIQDIVNGKTKQLEESALFAMTTNETYWFRDGYPFDILSSVLLPELSTKTKTLRIWSSACSMGQEPYSIAMAIDEFQQANRQPFSKVEIVATDISQPVLHYAREGLYDNDAISRGLSQKRLNQYFTQLDQKWQIKDDIKRMVSFKQLNLLDRYNSLGTFDVIYCRNVLIYFDSDTVGGILQKFSAQLPQDRFLFLGAAESAGIAQDMFKMMKQPQGLYYQRL